MSARPVWLSPRPLHGRSLVPRTKLVIKAATSAGSMDSRCESNAASVASGNTPRTSSLASAAVSSGRHSRQHRGPGIPDRLAAPRQSRPFPVGQRSAFAAGDRDQADVADSHGRERDRQPGQGVSRPDGRREGILNPDHDPSPGPVIGVQKNVRLTGVSAINRGASEPESRRDVIDSRPSETALPEQLKRHVEDLVRPAPRQLPARLRPDRRPQNRLATRRIPARPGKSGSATHQVAAGPPARCSVVPASAPRTARWRTIALGLVDARAGRLDRQRPAILQLPLPAAHRRRLRGGVLPQVDAEQDPGHQAPARWSA